MANQEPKATTSSDYGKLALDLRFESGDFVIKLSPSPDDWLILHSKVVAAACEPIRRSLNETWDNTAKCDEITHPATGETVKIRTLAMKRVEETYFLDGKIVDLGDDDTAVYFSQSSFVDTDRSDSEGEWPELYNPHNIVQRSQKAFRIIFSLLYNAQLDYTDLDGVKELHYYGIWYLNRDVFDMVVNVCAQAQYLECLDTIKFRVMKAYQTAPGYWTAVADQPMKHIELAIKLQLSDVYFDALRHLIAQAYQKKDWKDVANVTGYTEDQMKDFYEPQLSELDQIVERLKADILRLHLQDVSPTKSAYYGNGHTAYTTFMQANNVKKRIPPASERAYDKCGFIGRSIFAEWFIQQLSGDRVYKDGKYVRSEPVGCLSMAILKIEKAARSSNAAYPFGIETPSHLSDVFDIPPSHIHGCLASLVRKANDLIQEAFAVRDVKAQLDGVEKMCRRARARFDAHQSGYHTYLQVPKEVPWNLPKAKEARKSTPIVPNINVTPASKEWVAAITHGCDTTGGTGTTNSLP